MAHSPHLYFSDYDLEGGDSFIATKLVLEIRETFKIDFALPDFFDAPNLNELSTIIEKAISSDTKIGFLPVSEFLVFKPIKNDFLLTHSSFAARGKENQPFGSTGVSIAHTLIKTFSLRKKIMRKPYARSM